MEKKDLQIEMAIFISKECKYTKRFFGWNEDMDKFKGTIQIIDSFNTNNHYHITCYDTGSYKWSVRDLELLPKSSKPKTIHFNIKDLNL